MPNGVQIWTRSASGDDGVVFDPALWELDLTGNVLRELAAAEEEGSAGAAASRADLMALPQVAAAAAELFETVAALESQVHSTEIATHDLNEKLSCKDKEISRLKAYGCWKLLPVGPTAPPPFLLFYCRASFSRLAVSRMTLETTRMVSRHARGNARQIDGQSLSVNHYERHTHM
jgi:hypothetical protein